MLCIIHLPDTHILELHELHDLLLVLFNNERFLFVLFLVSKCFILFIFFM